MSILRRARPITEERTALAFFTDRQHACRRFAAYLDGEIPLDTILFFYGDGGNGKSLLLHFLETYYCQGHDPRQWADAQPDASPVGLVAVPTARLDFAPLPGGDESHQRVITGLLRLRRTLGEQGLRFPLFDYAGILYLKRTEGLSNDRIRALFPAEEADLVAALIDTIAGTSYAALGKAVLDVFSKYFGAQPNEWFTLWLQRRGIRAEDLDVLRRMDPERELLQELPQIFAEDLNAAMRSADAPRRVVLFFDTHEAFWGAQRDQQGERYFIHDEWLRCLLATLDRQLGIVTVVAGRERPRWHLAEHCPIDERLIEARQIAHLSDADARAYLGHIGLADDALCERLLDTARVAADEIHPLYLGLCADIVRAAAAQGTPLTSDAFANDDQVADKGVVLLDRLLRYTDAEVRSAVEILSAARAFNRDLYLVLGRAMAFSATRAAFDTLTKFSFVWPTRERGGDWYHIHPLIRRVLAQDDVKQTTLEEAHAALELHYRQQAAAGERYAIAEAIYHANQREWQRGVVEWTDCFDQALQVSDYGLCAALIELRGALRIDTTFQQGRALEREGRYYATLARYSAAQRQYTDAIAAYDDALRLTPDDIYAHTNKGNALQRLGEVLATLAQHEQAQQAYAQAITVYDTVLRYVPDDIAAHNNKGFVLQSLGELLATLAQHEQAQQAYAQAIIAYDTVLRLAPDNIVANKNKGNTLARLGEMLSTLAQHAEAQQAYKQAITAYNTTLARVPDDPEVHNNKGSALQCLGESLARQAQHVEAQQAYEQAIVAYNTALHLAPDYINAHTNKGNALQVLGDLLSTQAQHVEAQQAYEQAIAAHDTALRFAPDDIYVHNNRGNALARLGELLATLAQHDAAQQAYEQAITAYDTVLRLAPDDIYAHINKGSVLQHLGRLLARLAQPVEAQQAYTQAITAYDAALRLAPNDPAVYNNKGVSLQRLGELLARLAQHVEAQQAYEQAIAAHNTALRLAPDDIYAHNNKGNALACLGELLATLAQHDAAQQAYEQAITAYDTVLRLAPDYIYAHNNKGSALRRMGELLATQAQHNAAQQTYAQAIAAYDTALRLAPDYVYAHINKGLALQNLAMVLAATNDTTGAIGALQAAIACWQHSLALAPGDQRIQGWLERAQQQLEAWARGDTA